MSPIFQATSRPSFRPTSSLQLRLKSEKAARAVIDRFEDAAKRSLLSVEHRLHLATEAGAAVVFSTSARRFDLSVLLQTEPGSVNNDDMIEASLFEIRSSCLSSSHISRGTE